jgi:hypothetical protein
MGTVFLLAHAGIPFAYWPLALPCYCFGRNVAVIDGDSPYRKRFGDNFDQTKMFPFGTEIMFIPSKVTGDQTLQFDTTTQPGIFLGYATNSGCVWNGAYLVARKRQFTTMRYHAGRRKDDDKTIVIQMVRDVRRMDNTKDGEFRFPLNEHYDRAFNTPEGWLDSWWREQPTICRIPTPDDKSDPLNASNEILRVRVTHLGADPDGLPDSAKTPPHISNFPSGVQDSTSGSKDLVCVEAAVMIPAGNGSVTITPEIAGAERPTDDGSDLGSVLSDAESEALEAVTNMHEFAYDDWMRCFRDA